MATASGPGFRLIFRPFHRNCKGRGRVLIPDPRDLACLLLVSDMITYRREPKCGPQVEAPATGGDGTKTTSTPALAEIVFVIELVPVTPLFDPACSVIRITPGVLSTSTDLR